MKVFKFGGASVKDAAAVRNMAAIVNKYAANNQLLVVVSAMGKTTNHLENLYQTFLDKGDYHGIIANMKQFHTDIVAELFADQDSAIYTLLDKLFDRLAATLERQGRDVPYEEGYDQIICYGEIISTHIVAHYLRQIETNAVWLDARQYIQTDNTWREGKVDWSWTEKIIQNELKKLLQNNVIITQGFIGGTVENQTTTLGREGSDFSAAVFAYCLDAESLTIWKDVPGILNADPKRLINTSLYTQLSYTDAAEMTYYGATVIHPKTIKPLANKRIPLHVRSFLDSEQAGTTITTSKPEALAPAIIFKDNQKLVSIGTKDYAFITDKNLIHILEVLNRLNIKVNLMQNSAISVSISIDNNERKVERLIEALGADFDLTWNDDLQLITIKNYDEASISSMTTGKDRILEQKTRHNFQVLVRGV